MFNNIGNKIKTVAMVAALLGINVSIIVGAIGIYTGAVVRGLLIIIVGSLVSWISSFMTYGFGQLVENSDILVERIQNEDKYQSETDNYKLANNQEDDLAV